ncbi:hypothetical protein SUGI_0094150 [Cryptomeria japonica]|nr:hypothetical protein SUGI_0094150 [Cryptomeria japonica]
MRSPADIFGIFSVIGVIPSRPWFDALQKAYLCVKIVIGTLMEARGKHQNIIGMLSLATSGALLQQNSQGYGVWMVFLSWPILVDNLPRTFQE